MTDGMKCPRCGAPSVEDSIYCKRCNGGKKNAWSK